MADYVALPLLGEHSPRSARRLAVAMLQRLGAVDAATARWQHLTDSERTLVALAHALVRAPHLLVADDPTANLSVLQREEVLRLLRRAADADGLGILLTVPDMPDVVHADKVGSLADGHLLFSPPLDEHDNVFDLRPRESSG
jgi:ABC-type phosphate/phosphonate transport system ATPase subunit